MSKRCTWAVVTEKFAEMMTKEEPDGSAEGYVNLYQKIVDLSGKSNYIVILNSHKILYCVDGKVKMLPEMKINIADASSFDSIFVGSLSFALMNNIALDDAIKFANTAAAISLSRIGEVDAIPEIDEVLDNSGLREKFGLKSSASTVAAPVAPQPLAQNANVTSEATTDATQAEQVEVTPQVDAFQMPANNMQNNVVNSGVDINNLQMPINNVQNQEIPSNPAPVNMLEPNTNNINANNNV